MDKRSHPHVIRTWAVERIRSHAQPSSPGGLAMNRKQVPGQKPVPRRRKSS
ncbi:MAG: hypothetical protein KatS3mg004_0507 [Bryobacteraceae bacterium]|nr:MAG: hypothetical protein KatS3mg004_0507 [Bryobacteraceae bacterium]